MAKPTLKSNDYDKDQKSFTLETNEGYFIRETVAYVKGTPATNADAVTVIVWFHGFYVNNRGTLFHDVKGEEVKLLENLKSCPIKELIFVAPWMGYVQPTLEFVLDKNKQKIPLRDKANNIIPDKFQQQNIGSPQNRAAAATLPIRLAAMRVFHIGSVACMRNGSLTAVESVADCGLAGFPVSSLVQIQRPGSLFVNASRPSSAFHSHRL